jgi:carbon-monoxide dehydrogenase large subunit
MTTRFFGQRIKRLEDPALLTGQGRFTDDIHVANTLHAAFVRAPMAHAKVGPIDAAAARAMPGVHAVITAADLPASMRNRRIPLDVPNAAIRHPLTETPLVTDEVVFAGQTVAMVVADSRQAAEDAADAMLVDYEPLSPVADVEVGFAPGAPTVHQNLPDNIAARWSLHYGEPDAAFANAPHVISQIYRQHRGTGCPMEGRAVLAEYDARVKQFTVHTATQAPHGIRRAIAEMFDMPETDVRVIAPDVGGGFGPKLLTYPEEIMVPFAARLLGRPVKWTEDRREHLITAAQERDQIWNVQLAADKDGKILALKGHLLHDTGAFLPWGIIMPYISSTTFPGPYVVPHFHFDTSVVMTNKVSTSPMRGAGRPQAVFAMERLMDQLGDELGLDRGEVRRRNLIPTERMPYPTGLIFRDGQPMTYDSGDYPACQKMALDRAGWDDFPARQQAALKQGRYIGMGIGNYVEGTGLGPFEGATARILLSGRVLLQTGAAAQGQGHRTVLAQIAADSFNVPMESVDVEIGDTASIAVGVGTFASRMMVNAGSSVRTASDNVALKLRQIAAAYFDVKLEDIELADGAVRVIGGQGGQLTFAEIAKMASGRPGFSLPKGVEPGLQSTFYFAPPQAAYSNGSHVAEVEVDPETGLVQVLRYIVGHDCGRLVNPLLVDGQIQGGVAHGIGNALLERMRYDEDANPLSTNLADYLLPDAGNVPDVIITHMESPSPLNPLGVKGAGEGGTIPAPAAIIAAVEDALRPFNVRITETPILPERLCQLIDAGRLALED